MNQQKNRYVVVHLICACVMVIVACGDSVNGKQGNSLSDSVMQVDSVGGDTTSLSNVSDKAVPRAIWNYNYETELPDRISGSKVDTLTPVQLVEFVNAVEGDTLKLVYQKISSDTIFVEVLNADYLTQRIGTTGAEAYIMECTYTLTESTRIKYVSFDFPEGDHFSPGTFSKQYFVDRAEANRKMNERIKNGH